MDATEDRARTYQNPVLGLGSIKEPRPKVTTRADKDGMFAMFLRQSSPQYTVQTGLCVQQNKPMSPSVLLQCLGLGNHGRTPESRLVSSKDGQGQPPHQKYGPAFLLSRVFTHATPMSPSLQVWGPQARNVAACFLEAVARILSGFETESP